MRKETKGMALSSECVWNKKKKKRVCAVVVRYEGRKSRGLLAVVCMSLRQTVNDDACVCSGYKDIILQKNAKRKKGGKQQER